MAQKSKRAQGGLFGSGREVAPLKQTTITPAPVPSTPFVQAPRVDVGGNLTRLAQSLSNLNQGLNNLANVNAQEKADPNSRANQEWAAKREQMTMDELLEEAKNNTPNGIRVREDALNVLMANKSAAQFKNDFDGWYMTSFDKTSGDIGVAFETYRRKYAEELPNDLARGAFYRLTETYRNEMVERDTKAKVDYTVHQIGSSLTDSFRNTISDATSQGKTPEKAAQLVFGNSATMAEFMQLAPQERDDAIFELVKEYAATGQVEMVKALLEGGEGVLDKPLIRGYGTKSLDIIRQAYEVRRGKRQNADLPTFLKFDRQVYDGTFTPEDAQEFIDAGISTQQVRNGIRLSAQIREKQEEELKKEVAKQVALDNHDFAKTKLLANNVSLLSSWGQIHNIHDVEIPNEKGTGYDTITREEQIAQIVRHQEAQWGEDAEALLSQGEPQENVQAVINTERREWYTAHGLKNEQWSGQLNGLGSQITVENLAKDPEAAAYAGRVFQLYLDLKSTKPAYLNGLLQDEDSKTFLETAYTIYQMRGGEMSAALMAAAHAVAQPPDLRRKRQLDMGSASDLTQQVLEGLHGVDANIPVNQEMIEARLQDLAGAGVPRDLLVQNATRDLKGTSFVYHGRLVQNLSDMPPDFLHFADKIVLETFETFKDKYGVGDVQDLYLQADTTGSVWTIHSKSHGGMQLGAAITPQSIERVRQKTREAQKDTLAKLRQEVDSRWEGKTKETGSTVQLLKTNPETTELFQQDKLRLENEIAYWEGELAAQEREGYVLDSHKALLEHKRDLLIWHEGMEMLSEGILPDSDEWLQWKVKHGRNVSILERDIYGDNFVPTNDKFKP